MADSKSTYVDVRRVPKSSSQLDVNANLLSEFVYPLSILQFVDKYFQKKCVALVGGGLSRLQNLVSKYLCGLDLEALLECSASDNISCWIRIPADGTIDTVRVQEAASAMTLHRAGASLYFRSSQEAADALIGRLARDLALGSFGFFDSRLSEPQGEIEVFVTRAGHHTDWHFDFQENFTFQLSGSKRWRLKSSGIQSPVRGATPHYATQAEVVEQQLKVHRLAGEAGAAFDFKPDHPSFFSDASEVVLRAGDCFYFPAGMWHSVQCLEEGISVNLSMVGTTWADCAASAIRTALWRDEQWRGMVSLGVAQPEYTGSVSSRAPSSCAADESKNKLSATGLLYSMLFPMASHSGSEESPGSSCDLVRTYTRLENMCAVASSVMSRAMRPEALVPPVAFLLNRMRPVLVEEEEEAKEEEDDDDEEGSSAKRRPTFSVANVGVVDGPRRGKRGRGNKRGRGPQKRTKNEEEKEGEDVSNAAGPGILVCFSNGTVHLRLDLHAHGDKSAPTERRLPSDARLAWNPTASWSTQEELERVGVGLIEADRSDSASESEDPSLCTLVIHSNFGGAELADSHRCLLTLPRAVLHCVRTLAARDAACTLEALVASADGDGEGRGKQKRRRQIAPVDADALARALLFIGAAVLA